MGEQIKKPYEISIWEDRLVEENGKSYYKEIKLAVIGSNTMASPNRTFNNIFIEQANGEKTLTFSIAYKYIDEVTNELTINPFSGYLINERKVKLHYNDKWYEFVIKECDETSEDYVFTYTARELFTIELSKVGYNITLDPSLNNNQGSIIELGQAVLADTDWQVDEDNSDLLQQLVQEPLYQCKTIAAMQVLNLDTNRNVSIAANETIYVFYSYITNLNGKNVQFIREKDRDNFVIDDNGVIQSTNYRLLSEVKYTKNSNGDVTKVGSNISVSDLYYTNQGYRLVYGQKTIYDPVMDRTVDLYQAQYDDGAQDIYHYIDYEYTTSDVVMSYVTNGSNFNVFDNGSLQGWSNDTLVQVSGSATPTLQPMNLVTYPEISATGSLSLIKNFAEINGFLELKFNNVLNSNYENTYFNSGFNDNATFVDHISAGEQFVLRLRYFYANSQHGNLIAGAPSTNKQGIRAVVAKYTTTDYECYLDDNAKTQKKSGRIKAYQILPSDIILQFDQSFTVSPNIINNGDFNSTYTQYIVDNVIQTPSTLYIYQGQNSSVSYVWDATQEKYIVKPNTYADYYMTTARARRSYSNEELSDPTTKIGIFLYTADSSLVNKYVYLQDIQLTRYYEAGGEVVTLGNVPTAVSTITDYYYVKPASGVEADEVNTYSSLDFLASELKISSDIIHPVYNEDCEKILSIQVEHSNCFNILQDLCETFECWLDINVPHNSDGSIALDSDYRPIKKVAFKRYAGKDNFSGFRNGINLKGITRNIDSNEIVTKLIVDSAQSDYTETGSIDIQSATSNPSGESFILNFSYYLNRGLITDVEACNKDLLNFYTQLKSLNDSITEKQNAQNNLNNSLLKISANRNVFDALISEAEATYNRAIADFYEATGYTYDEYVSKFHNVEEWAKTDSDNLVENDTIVELIGEIYSATVTINNYVGLLSNLNEEYRLLDLECNGAKEYGISVTTVPGNGEDILPATQVAIDDYISGLEFKLLNSAGAVVYNSSPNDRIFDVTNATQYEYIIFTQIPENYKLQYYVNNKVKTLDRTKVSSRTSIEEAAFKIIDGDTSKTLIRRFKLVPDEDYAASHIGYTKTIDNLIEDKRNVEKEFYKKYSRFIQEGTWNSQDYIDAELYYLDALQVSNVSAQPKVSYTIDVLEVSQLEGLESYDFAIGDKTYIEDADFFGYIVQAINDLIVTTPVKEEVIVSEIEWHLDDPAENIITIQNYKTQFEDLFQRISATVQTVQYNEATYAKTSSILDQSGLINSNLLSSSLSGASGRGFSLSSNGSVSTTNDGLLIRDLSNPANVIRIVSRGIQLSSDGGQSWSTAINAAGISTDVLSAGTINTQRIWLMDGDNPSFRWDKAGLNAYGLNKNSRGAYDLKTYVRFDKYGLYGIKNGEGYVASSLQDVKDKAHFGVTWDGFFIKNSYTNGHVGITSDNDFEVVNNGIRKIHIGAIEKNDAGAPTRYGINIRNNYGDVVFSTGDDGNLSVTGTINALAGNFTGKVTVGDTDQTHILIDGNTLNPVIQSSNYQDGAGLGWIIDGNGDAVFSNVSVRGAIKTAVFEYEEIQAVGGAFLFRPSSTIKSARIGDPEQGENEEDLIVTVEKPLMFRVGNWCKISNYNSLENDPAAALSTYGLIHIYKVTDISLPEEEEDSPDDDENPIDYDPAQYTDEVLPDESTTSPTYEITLRGGAAIVDVVALDNIPGGALIDFGNEEQSQNYGIGINSSDNYVNLPRRAISLFETEIIPTTNQGQPRIIYDYKGILGTLPRMSYSGNTALVNELYHEFMEDTQGIFTNNMYIGDSKQYIAFYTDNEGNKRLKIRAKDIVFAVNDDGSEVTYEDKINSIDTDGGNAVEVSITSSNGDKFINGNINTILTCAVYSGTVNITDQVTNFVWHKVDKNGQTVGGWTPIYAEEGSKRKIRIGSNDVEEKATFTCDISY